MFPAAVIFDMDGLMLDTEQMMRPCFQRAAVDIGCPVPDGLYDSLIGIGSADTFAILAERFGAAFRQREFEERLRELWHHRLAAGVPHKPGLSALLTLLERRGIPMAVATSTDASDAELCLRTAALWERFRTVVTGDQVPNGKPAPHIYLEAASRLRVEPERCVALEDSNNGVLAASRAGMRVLMVPDTACSPSREAVAAAWTVLPSLHEATQLIGEWLRTNRPTGGR